jgi:N-acetylglutamate synthase-like GNAT family acetyltransferase
MATDVQIVISDNKEFLDIEIVHGFLKRSSWAANRTRETLEKSISSSICFGAYAEKKQVAFARIVSDCCTFAYLCDVFVDENYRGRGISKELMTAIMKHPDLQSYRRFTLATENAHRLYAQFGFKNVPVNLFMEIKNDNI